MALLPSLLLSLLLAAAFAQEDQTCSWTDLSCYQDPHLREITVDVGTGVNETFLAYHPPDVSTFYQEEPGSIKPLKPFFRGLFGKFINMSPDHIKIYWYAGKGKTDIYIADCKPFETAGTATYPGHRFVVKNKKEETLHNWNVDFNKILYVYDPFVKGDRLIDELSEHELEQYNLQKGSLAFAAQYKAETGIEYLSLYPNRPPPVNPMWSADHFGQQHTVMTRETHFTELPPPETLAPVKQEARDEPMLQKYRDGGEMNMTLNVLSCSPRVFEIKNFLSRVEIDHIMELATGMTLHQSATKAGETGTDRLDDATRTSRNTWVGRHKTPILDAIYRRSADLLQIDEAYLRPRSASEMPHLPNSRSNAEQLQLVHYDKGQQYTPHHDFAMPNNKPGQPMRWATILFYLNEGMGGGSTTFPRWLNSKSNDELKVKPEIGKAILFYSLLPDGNMDERSQHAAKPILAGEKWLINLWVWDPAMRGM